MATNFYPAGLGGTVDLLVTNRPFYGLDSQALYVHFLTGVDTAGTAGGRDKQRPLKTLGKAIGNATPNDVIVLLDGHDETITTALTVNKAGLVIAGCGQTAGVPNCRLRFDSAVGSMLTFAAAGCQLRNVRIGENVQDNDNVNLFVNAVAGFVLDHCYVECGVNDYAGMTLGPGADYTTIRDSTFISTALTAGDQPFAAVLTTGAHTGLLLDGLVLSDGAVGFSSGYALNLSAGPSTNLRCERLSLLLGASAKLGAATGHVIPVVTGGGSIDP